jgi:hypothetical protein
MGTGGFIPGGKAAQGREADHSSPTSAEIKKTCTYTLDPRGGGLEYLYRSPCES